MQQPAGHSALPIEADIDKIAAVLREDLTATVLSEMADRLLQLAAAETHPRLRAALLDRAAALSTRMDPARSLSLWRESFRLFPDPGVGRRLHALASDDAGFARLGRLGHLADAIAEIADPGQREADLLAAVQCHIQQGHGEAAKAAIARLRALQPDHEQLAELAEVADQQVLSRHDALEGVRAEVAAAAEDDRPRLLVGYADMLLHGDEPLDAAAAVLVDAVAAGVPAAEVAGMWVEVARAMGDAGQLSQALALAVADAESPNRLQYADELANLPEVERSQPAGAVTALTLLAANAPDDESLKARVAVAEAFAQGVGAEAALEALRLRALQARDRVLESAACLALAQIAHANGDAEKAERHFRRVRSLSPHNPEALDFFEQWYRRAGDHRRLFAALTQRAAQSEGRVLVRIALEMAQLAEGPLATLDPASATDRAIEAYQRVLSVQPDHMDAIAALERLLTAGGRWQELAALLARSAHVFAPRAMIDNAARTFAITLWNRLSELHRDPERLADVDAALEASLHVLELDARQPEALAAVTATQEKAGDWPALRDTLLAAVDAAEDPHELAALSQQLGELFRDRLDDPAAAATWLDRAAISEPDRADARTQAQALWRARGDRDRLLDALVTDLRTRWGSHPSELRADQVIAVTPEIEREAVAGLLEEAARLATVGAAASTLVDRTPQQNFAATLWSQLLAFIPGHQEALDELADLWPESEDDRFLTLLQAQVAHPALGAERNVALLERLCALLVRALARASTPAGATASPPASARTQEVATAALAAAAQLRELAADSATAETTRLHALVALGELDELRATYPQDAEGGKAFAEGVTAAAEGRTAEQRVGLLQAAAAAVEATGQHDRAAELLADALSAAESLENADERQGAIVATAHALGRAAKQAGLLGLERLAAENLARHAPPHELAAHKQALVALLTGASLWSEAAAAAGDWIEELLAAGLWPEVDAAVAQLKEAARRAGEIDTVPHRLLAWAEVAPDHGEPQRLRVHLWTDAARLLVTAGNELETARRAADLAMEAQPDDVGVLSLRERICTEQADWAAVVATLERLAELQSGPERTDTLLRAANLCDHALTEPQTAAQLYRQVLDESAEALEAWYGLAAALRKCGTVDERADVLDALLVRDDLSRDSRARLALERVELGKGRAEPEPAAPALAVLARLAAALDAAGEAILPLNESENGVVAVGLSRLEVPGEGQEVAELLLPILRAIGGGDPLATDGALRCLDVLAAGEAATNDQRLAWLQEAATWAGAADPQRQYAAARAAAVANPSVDLLAQAASAAPQAGAEDDFDALLLVIAGGEADVATRFWAAERLADRCEARSDPAQAVAAWTLAHEIAPVDPLPLRRLAELFGSLGDTEGVAFALREQTTLGDAEAQVAAWKQLIELALTTVGDAPRAAATAQEAVAAHAGQAALWDLLLRALREAMDDSGLLAALQERERQPGLDAAQRAEMQREIAQLHENAQDFRSALAIWLDLANDNPEDDEAAGHATVAFLELAADGMPDDLGAAAQALCDVLDLRGDAERLTAVIALRLANADTATRPALLRQLVGLHESQHNAPAAFEAAEALLALEPEEPGAIARIEAVGAAAELPPERIAAALLAATAAAGPAMRQLLREAAVARLDDDPATLTQRLSVCAAALTDAPDDRLWLQRADAWAVAAGDDVGRLALLARRIAATAEVGEALELQRERALLADRLGERGVARTAWEALLAATDAEKRREAAAALVDLSEREGDAAGEARALTALCAETNDPEGRTALTLRLAAAWGNAGDAAAALPALRAAVAAEPNDTSLFHALTAALPDGAEKTSHLARGWQTVLDDAGVRLAAAEAWLSAQKSRKPASAWQHLRQVLDAGVRGGVLTQRVAALAAADDDGLAIEAGTRLAALAAEANDRGAEVAARSALLPRLEGEAAHAARRLVAALLQSEGRLEEALGHLRAVLSATWDRALAEDALVLAARVGQTQEVAEEIALRAAAGLPTAEFDHLADFLPAAELVNAAAPVLLARLGTEPDRPGQANVLHALFALAARHGLEALAGEIAAVAAALPAIGELMAFLPDAPLLDPLRVRLAEAALAEAPPEARAAAVRTVARLRATVGGDVVGALDLLLRSGADGEPLAALNDALVLAKDHARVDVWLDAAENLLLDADLTVDQRFAAAGLAAAVATELGEGLRAATLWQLVWDDDPENPEARDRALTLWRQAGHPAQLAAAIERAMLLGGEVDRGALRVELATLRRGLGKNRDALRLLQDAVAAEPDRSDVMAVAESLLGDPQILDETLELLERVYRQQGEWERLADVLQQRMDRAHRPTQRVALAQALATLQQQHGDVESAAAALLAALRAAPSMDALAAVERLCSAQSQPDVLAEAYAVILEANLPPQHAAMVLQRAVAFELARGESDLAEGHLRTLIGLRPDDDAVFSQLSGLLATPERRGDLLAAWQLRLAANPNDARRREGLRQITALARALGQRDVALAAAEAWSELAPDESAALEALVDQLRELDRSAELAAALVALAQLLEGAAERATVLDEAAREYERLQDADAQHAAYEGAFESDPTDNESFVFLERKAGPDPGKVIPLYARRSDALAPGPSRTLILRKLANAAAELNDGATACRALESAIADDPANVAVLDELLRIAEQQHEWSVWLRTADKRLGAETRKEGKAALRRQMARVCLTEEVDIPAATAHIAALEKLAPADPSVAQLRTMLQARSADPREAAAGLEALAKHATDAATQASIHQQLADLYAGPLDNVGKAIRELVRLVQLDPRRWQARRRLCDLYKARGSMEAYAESLRQWLQTLGESRDTQTLSPERIAQLGALQLELGEALAAVGKVAEAAGVLRDALILNGHSARLDAILAQMLEATSDPAGAAELEDWLVGYHALGDREQMAHHAQRAGQLWEQLGAHQKARDAFRKLLEVRPDDPPATLGLGRACLEMGDTDRALRLFDTVSRSVKASAALRADALVGMGRCRMSRLALDQARNCYERALQLVPGHRGALDGLSEL